MTFSRSPDWREEGVGWPFAEHSRFVQAGGLTWHVQELGEGPPALLLHGTGAATHSWRGLYPALAPHHRLIGVDLPGHGFTAGGRGAHLSLPGMAAAVAALLAKLRVSPKLAVGHSAGAAVMLRLALDGALPGAVLVGLNAALKPFPGAASVLFPAIARLLFYNPVAPAIFSARARQPGAVERLLSGVGSTLDPEGVELYRRLLSTPGHVAGALGMMSSWDLTGLLQDLSRLEAPLLLLAGARDLAVPSSVSHETATIAPLGEAAILPALGHLAHEEAPERVAERILAFTRRVSEDPSGDRHAP